MPHIRDQHRAMRDSIFKASRELRECITEFKRFIWLYHHTGILDNELERVAELVVMIRDNHTDLNSITVSDFVKPAIYELDDFDKDAELIALVIDHYDFHDERFRHTDRCESLKHLCRN